MLYSLISAVAPSKCFSQTKVRRRTRLFARPSIPEFRMASSSARSDSNLLMDECKRPSPGKIARAFHNLGSLGRVYRNFPERAASEKALILMELERNPEIKVSSRKDSKSNPCSNQGSMAEDGGKSPSRRSPGKSR